MTRNPILGFKFLQCNIKMKLIIAIIQPDDLPYIKEELLKNQIYKFAVSAARGRGKELLFTEVYVEISNEISLLKRFD